MRDLLHHVAIYGLGVAFQFYLLVFKLYMSSASIQYMGCIFFNTTQTKFSDDSLKCIHSRRIRSSLLRIRQHVQPTRNICNQNGEPMYLLRNTNYSIEVHTMFMVNWPDIWQQINVCDFQLLTQHFLTPKCTLCVATHLLPQ